MFATVRSKTLIDHLFNLGLCISYKRILEITKNITDYNLQQFDIDNVFIPKNSYGNAFTVIAKDNIDLNASSTTAKNHYHGTSLSMLNFPSNEDQGIPLKNTSILTGTQTGSLKVNSMPESYSTIQKLHLPAINGLYAPLSTTNLSNNNENIMKLALDEERNWLQNYYADKHGWSSFHASYKRHLTENPGVSTILPLIREKVHTLDTQYHCMDIISRTISTVNPTQTPVDVCDQPVYALTKQIQWRLPERFGDSKYFTLFGGLHIEKAFIVHGKFIKGSGLEKLLGQSNLSITGLDNAVLNVSDIKRSRYGLQLSACAIYQQLLKACSQSETLSMWDWLENRSKESVMSFYWKTILDLELHILIFIRSIRESNFALYISSLRSLMKWFFALDHYNYARWLSVHIHDLLKLEYSIPDVFQNFQKGHFAFQKSLREFSNIALDQVHEQNNAVLKGVGGVTHLLNKEDESALLRWELCSHDLAELLLKFEDLSSTDNTSINSIAVQQHHEDTRAFRERFNDDINKLTNSFTENPFSVQTMSPIDNLGVIYDNEVSENIKNIQQIGETQFNEFFYERLVLVRKPVDGVIKANNIKLPGYEGEQKSKKECALTTTMMSKLRSCYEYRRENVYDTFKYELFGIAQSIADGELNLYHGKKSDILKRLEPTNKLPTIAMDRENAIVIELSAVIQAKANSKCTTFNDFASILFFFIMGFAKQYHRCEIIADRYFQGSLKEGTRDKRGNNGSKQIFDGSTLFPNDFTLNFMKNSDNKTKLNLFLAKKFIEFHKNDLQILVITFNDTILSNNEAVLTEESINYCNIEEADARLVRHCVNLSKQGFKHIVLCTVDTDVLVLVLAYSYNMLEYGAKSIFVKFGTGFNVKFYNVFEIASLIGSDVCKGLPFFYAFTGCDSTSSFYRHGKCKFWDTWVNNENTELTSVFIELSDSPIKVEERQIDAIEHFLMSIYFTANNSYSSIDEARVQSFFKSPDPDLRSTILSRSGLTEHIKRSCLIAGWVWKGCLYNVEIPDPTSWGWLCSSVFR